MVGYAIYLKKRKKKAEEWLQKLLKSEFFDTCNDHQRLRKNDINLFCIDCYQCFCQHCLSTPSHCAHKLLQIRRYVYHNVVCIHDMQKHLDCSRVQPYTLNNSKVVFLNPRPQLKPNKSNNGACCKVCQRSLSESNQYCSIACKVSANLDKSNNRNNSSFLSFPIPEFRDIYVEEEDIDNRTDTTDTADDRSSEDSSMIDDDGNQYWVSKSGVLKPKKQCHKRKGVPHRAPLC